MERKGQSALEYLMTYGWALIVIAIVIGVLVFIMSTTTSASTCTSDNTQITYVDHIVNTSDSNATLILTNAAGKTINVTAVSGTGDFSGTLGSPIIVNESATPDPIGAGLNLEINQIEAPSTSGSYRGTLAVTYTRTGLTHTATLTCSGSA